ncbi:hypothetical protein NL676_020279 [Syzygium grande]|nr:hypothetical protein NL676_020279 [Syzygium grande]
MASEQDGAAAVFPDEEDLDDDDDDSQDDDDDDADDEEEELLPNRAVLPDDDDDVFDDDSNSASTSSSLPTATPLDALLPLPLPLPSAGSSSSSAVTVAVPAPLRPDPLPAVLKRPSPAVTTVAKPLFQRLWTDEDEIELLRGFLEYTTQRGGAPSGGHHDTAAFYDQIKSKLQLDFNKNQLVEKLRRLKKKYRNVIGRMSSGKDFAFKSPHDQATFEISRRIWTNVAAAAPGSNNDPIDDEDDTVRNPNFNNHLFSTPNPNPFFDPTTTPTKSRKRQRPPHPQPHAQQVQVHLQQVKVEERNLGVDGPTVSNHANQNLNLNANASANANANPNVAGVIEDTVRSCLSPLFKELLSGAAMGGGFGGGGSRGGFGYVAAALNPLPFSCGLGFGVGSTGEIADERWRKQQIMELEVYSKRLELVQDHIKATIEELRSSGGG